MGFRDAFVPDDHVLGGVDEGFRYAQVRLGPARMTHVMRWTGAVRRAHEVAVRHVASRRASTRLDLGLMQQLIADNEIDLAATRALLLQACIVLDDGGRGSQATSIAKTFAAEALHRVADRAVQMCGGMGVSTQLPVAKIAREVRPFRIYDGPSEVHRWSIAKRAVRAITGERRDDILDGSSSSAWPPAWQSRRPTERPADLVVDRRRSLQPHLPPRRRYRPVGPAYPTPIGAHTVRSRRRARVPGDLSTGCHGRSRRPCRVAVRGRRRPGRPVLVADFVAGRVIQSRKDLDRLDSPTVTAVSQRLVETSPRSTGSTRTPSASSASDDPTPTPLDSSGDGWGNGSWWATAASTPSPAR